MNTIKKLQQARLSLLFDHPFFGYLAAGMELVEKKDLAMPTMATNGRDLYYHPDFVEQTPLPQLMGAIAHEIMHCVLGHIPRAQNRVHERWNDACDYVDNDLLVQPLPNGQPEFQLPAGCLVDDQWHNQHAEYVYNHLPAKKKGEGGSGFDSHVEWGEWGKGNGKGDGDGKGDGGEGQNERDDGSPMGDALEQEWREKVAQAANAARMRGKLPGHIAEAVHGALNPVLDWREILEEMIASAAKSDFRMFPPNKRHIARGFILPSLTGQTINVAVGVDTSGSVSDQEVHDFLSEVKGICDTYESYTLNLAFCDTQISSTYRFEEMDEFPDRFAYARGGTDFRPIFKWADELIEKGERITALVIMTDMYGPWPEKEPEYQTIWLATSDVKPDYGVVIEYPKMKD